MLFYIIFLILSSNNISFRLSAVIIFSLVSSTKLMM